jgi:addiction module HigA family antidote
MNAPLPSFARWPAFGGNRAPLHPGRFLATRILAPLGLSQLAAAQALGMSRRRLNEMIHGRRAITPDTALRLAACFGVDAGFWLHLQADWDLYTARRQQAGQRIPH